jgi:glucuronate isomerase
MHERGWVKQLHLGALRNNNTRLLKQLGPDTGFDSIGDFPRRRASPRISTASIRTTRCPRRSSTI